MDEITDPKLSKKFSIPIYKSRFAPIEQPIIRENLLHVYMGGTKLLLPTTPEYGQYDGLETGALATCTGLALYVPQEKEVILGVAHLMPSQGAFSVIEQFSGQLNEAGLDPEQFYGQEGFIAFIPGQTTYDRDKTRLREEIIQTQELLRRQFPKIKNFPLQKVSYSVLSGHLSSSVKLFKDGRLVIAGEGKAY